jgi:hypothetical protein
VCFGKLEANLRKTERGADVLIEKFETLYDIPKRGVPPIGYFNLHIADSIGKPYTRL